MRTKDNASGICRADFTQGGKWKRWLSVPFLLTHIARRWIIVQPTITTSYQMGLRMTQSALAQQTQGLCFTQLSPPSLLLKREEVQRVGYGEMEPQDTLAPAASKISSLSNYYTLTVILKNVWKMFINMFLNRFVQSKHFYKIKTWGKLAERLFEQVCL